MPITSNGFEARRFSDIVSEINQDQINNLAADLDTTPETVLGVITSIFSTAISDQENLNQAVSDNFSIDKAEGKWLDDLTALQKKYRLDEAPTTGVLEVTGDDLTTIPVTATFSDNNNTFIINEEYLIAQAACVSARYSISSVLVGFNYTVKINSVLYTYTAQTGDTVEDIVNGLITSSEGSVVGVITYDADNLEMVVSSKQQFSQISVFAGSKFVNNSVTSLVYVENSVNGAVEVEPETVTEFSGITGVSSVTNPTSFTVGRLRETDEELRARFLLTPVNSGNTTIPSIKSRLLQVNGVTSLDIIENTSAEYDTDGRPPNSYEVIITGGSNRDISEAIFYSKPAGIRTYGDILGIVTYENQLNSVYYSRPVDVFAWVRVSYSVYDEEIFPVQGETIMKESIVEYGDALGNGKDVIPKRLYTPVYQNVDGVNDLLITCAITTDPFTPPDLEDYTEDLISISQKERANFNIDRVTIL